MNKVTSSLLVALALVAGLIVSGCGSPPEAASTEEVNSEIKTLGDAARTAKGNFDSLTEDQKQLFISRTGSEAAARQMVSQMGGGGGPRGAAANP